MSRDALDVALALHSAPGRVDEMRTRPLPRGIADLLRVALGQPASVAQAATMSRGDALQMVEAARFFVEQQMLSREFEDDPWRMLGVAPGASEGEIRDHHHLLVRLVHPDRSNDWASAYAERVNKAWRQLRHAEGRAEALAAFESAPPGRAEGDAWVPVVATAARSAFRPDIDLVPSPDQSPMRWPWALAAALAVLMLVYALRAPRSAPPETQTEVADAMPGPWYEAGASSAANVAAASAIDELVPLALLTPPAAEAPLPGREVPALAKRVEAAPAQQPTVAKIARLPAAKARPVPIGNTSFAVSRATAPVPESPAAVALALPVPTRTLPSYAETVAVLDGFSRRYAEGNLSALLGLFASQVHAESSRVAAIASTYSALFTSTHTRNIAFSDLQWQEQGNRVTGRGRYESRQQRRTGARARIERGRIEFELIRDGDEPRLLRLDAFVEDRS